MERGKKAVPYGSWPSPLSAPEVARGEVLPEWLAFVGDEVWWTEARPEDGGRGALVRRGADGTPDEVLPPGWDVRNRVIQYGSRPWLPLSARPEDGIAFTHWADQRVHRWQPGGEPVPLSPPAPDGVALHYGDFAVHGGELWCLRETVTDPRGVDVERHLVALPLDGSAADDPAVVRVLAASHHFMTGPRIAPDGRSVAWLGWQHPSMPWDTTELMVAEIGPDATLAPPVRLAGGGQESITQIEWAPGRPGVLYAVTDPTGWWNVHEILPDGTSRNLCPRQEEFGEALWRIGLRWCLPLADGRLAVLRGVGERGLSLLSPDGTVEDVESPYSEWHSPATDGRRVAAVAAGPGHGRTVVLWDPSVEGLTVLRRPHSAHDELASPAFRRTYRDERGQQVHAHVYPPHHPEFTAPEGELPPYLVFVHGGPTSRSHLVRNQEIGYFTSRGIGVVDVQYGGSTGYGRVYRERLRGMWGVVDVEDCATVVDGMVAEGLADPRRIAIRGGSAGGWTATAALIADPGLYRAAGIYYPVLDPVSWRSRGTHDFESRYLDGLVGPWPEAADRYDERSAVHRADLIRTPFVLLQGLDDTVCPPAQAEQLLERLKDSQVPFSYLTFDGEGHGFRRAETITACLRAELSLYGEALGFVPAPE
ncbi:prolyl oligopeptidase family serine peptidase [Streptomyces sp. NPDC048506]|uniref:alpha/beta hydrolase family protein n=1 Tax=Streptomyces sp. NPDC048506 TaxID=3155028 RepID=UPI003433B648